MYKCTDCGRVFDEPRMVRLTCHDFGPPVFRMVARCPECRSDEFEEVEECCRTCMYYMNAVERCCLDGSYKESCDKCNDWEFDGEEL